MNGKTCFYIGNRNAPNSIKAGLAEAVEKHITEYGVTIFTVGHYGSFDRLAATVLREAKKRHTNIKLYLLAPYALTQKIEPLTDFDGTVYPEGMETVPKPLAIVQANRKMIEQTNYLIYYCHNITGNTRKFIEYAKKREKKALIKITLL